MDGAGTGRLRSLPRRPEYPGLPRDAAGDRGLSGLDVGCGEGHNTRLLAERGARMTGIDISVTFIRHAKEAEDAHRVGIDYRLASAVDLPFHEAGFDFVTAFMSLMD